MLLLKFNRLCLLHAVVAFLFDVISHWLHRHVEGSSFVVLLTNPHFFFFNTRYPDAKSLSVLGGGGGGGERREKEKKGVCVWGGITQPPHL